MSCSKLVAQTKDKKIKTTNITWIIVPAKPLEQAKSRLAAVLTIQERQNLAFHLLEHTLQILTRLQKRLANTEVLLVSSDPALLNEASKYNAHIFFDNEFAQENESSLRLNKALSQAAQWCFNQVNTAALLILPADLPCLQLEDLLYLFETATAVEADQKFLINSDRSFIGTNALFIQPADLLSFDFNFGPASFAAHLKQAKSWGVTPQVIERPGLLFDLDTPADFYHLPADLQQSLLAPIALT